MSKRKYITEDQRLTADAQIKSLQRQINYDTKDYTVELVVQKFKKDEFFIPDYQRGFVYNLVEACVVSGMLEIYESLKQSQSGYNELIEEIQSLWSKYKIGEIYKSSGTRSSYEKGVREIIAQVITDEPVFLNRAALEISGNLDARRIKNLCDKHCIRYVASDDDGCLKTVKEKRQNLAHGDESFGDCARDMTLSQLEHIKDEVIWFIGSILNGMKNYYDNKLYLREPEKKKKKASKC